MRRLLMKVGAPIAVGALVLTAFNGAASANAKHPATTKPTFAIAYEGPLTGGNAVLGQDMIYSVEFAISQANAGKSFGNLPFKLTFVRKDDQGLGPPAATDAQELVADKQVIGMVGPAFSASVQAAEPTLSAANLAMISPSATRVTLADHNWPNFFRVVADDGVQGPSDANYVVKKLGKHNLYVVNDATTYGSPLANAFAAQARADGAKVTTNTFPETGGCGGTASATQYTADAATIKSANPGLVFYSGYYCDLGLLIGALHKAGYKGVIFSDDGSDTSALITSTNPHSAANGVYVSCACSVLGSTTADKVFAAGFQKLAHFAPAVYSAESFDAASTLIDELKILAKHGVGNITRHHVVSGLHTITYVGLTKTIHFKSDGNISGTAIYVNKIENGKLVQLGLE